ncbi:hypothetical protein QN383_18640 [Pseudomonas sp. AA4]|uniref:hypothetical protein n=1 Tax=unclassified Pseudomonas TaxID=196821 RepID=UPI002B23721D|nr:MULTISPECIES: hypothetical protein [unclassified Pseudomonas]MEA9996453.1 hypothetical protein [Pseudomonas sp. AA4]MEB0222199.1 hypothetical protein [Pseudomonas sp. AB12(2023)]
MMKSRISLIMLALLSLVSVAQAGQTDTASDLSKLASKTLQVDGITDAQIVEVMKTNPQYSPFIFTYCRKGSPSLWRYEVISSDGPASRRGVRTVKSQAVVIDSESCKAES